MYPDILAASGRTRRLAWRALLSWLLLIALPLLAAAQNAPGRITGRVTDVTGGVLPGVSVTVKGPDGHALTVTSDADGRFVIDQVAPGTYELRFELSGFAGQSQTVVVAPGPPIDIAARLEIGGRSEAVEVTGSLIPRPTLEAMSPVTTLEVEELTYRGMTRLEDLLTTLPQVFTAQNSTVSNGSSGTATVDLRGLGDFRTLVLLDGRRLGADSDLNFIPSALVKRVDVLTGGASSVYGSDAVAGVVNFILDKDFTGFKGGVEYSGFQHNNRNALAQSMNAANGFTYPSGSAWNAGPTDFNLAFGGKFADHKGHASFYLDYRTTNAITEDARDYTNCASALGTSGPVCSGSATWQNGRFTVYNSDYSDVANYVLDVSPTTDPSGNQFRLRTSADVYNYAPANFMQRPDKRWAGGAFLNYEFHRMANLYGEVMFMDDVTDAQIAPSGDFGNSALLNCDNPMLSAQEVQLLCTDMGYGPHDVANVFIYRRNVEGGPRVSHLRHTTNRISVGLRGQLNDAWSYDAYGLQVQMDNPSWFSNDLNANRIQDALLVGGTPGQPDTWYCLSGNPGCVPWDIFKVGGVTQAALDYLKLFEIGEYGTRTRIVSARLSGDLKEYGVVTPTAIEGVKVALGFEYRQEYSFWAPDEATSQGLGAGTGGPSPAVAGTYSVKEFFGEALIPLVQDRRWTKDLSLELGLRESDYTSTGRHATYKVQGSWAPTADVKLRVGYNRATRSPNIFELYTPQGLYLGGNIDPCAGANPTATLAQCERTGMTSAQYGIVSENPSPQYNALGGGNPNLAPETANTWTGGLVATPRGVLRGLAVALDYYDIKITQTIGSLGYNDILNQCLATGTPALCDLIHRDRLGSLWMTHDGYIMTTSANIGELKTQGVDVNASYSRPMGDLGLFSVNLIGTYMRTHTIDTGLYNYDCVGYFGLTCGTPTPRWRHLARFSWETPWKVTVSVGWRMLGGTTIDEASPNPALANPGNIDLDKINNVYQLSARHFIDLGATWKITKNIQFVAGVDNVLDKEPPFLPGISTLGFSGTYNPLGRYVHTGLQFTF